MPDEWVCDACGHTTSVDPVGIGCPQCDNDMIKMDAKIEAVKEKKQEYSEKESDTPMEDFADLDFEDEIPKAA